MDLTPEYIEANLEKFGDKAARDTLKQWIINSDNKDLRIRALNLYQVIDDEKQFKFLEQLFLSDENFNVRAISGNILRDKYFHNKKFVPLLEFSLNNGNDIDQKLFAVELLNLKNTKNSRKIIKEYLKRTLKLNQKNKLSDISEEIFTFDFNLPIPPNILEICHNLILYLYYTDNCGYSVALKEGLITLLNCEGSVLESIAEIKGLSRLFKLEHLFLQRNNIKKICGLDHLKLLITLNLSQNQICQIDKLDELINLKELNLSSNRISKIDNLNNVKLKKLLLDKNSITEIENLDKLVNLEHLNLSYNNISKLKNFNHLIGLKSLYLSFNNIEKISGLENLEALTTLYFNDNRICNISGLGSLVSLKVLNLSNNLINNIVGLENLENLIKLELSNNKIKSLSGLDTLQNLQELFVDKNHVKNLEGIRYLKSLIILFLENNDIKEFKLSFIDKLVNLNFIFLNQNPLNPESWDLYQKRTRYP
jgi:hypothetical protein